MSALDNLTVCITSFKRAAFLDRAITSCRAAGIKRLAIAAVEFTDEIQSVIENKYTEGWTSFDLSLVQFDIGCNNTWMLAAYRAQTERILILHDDDQLCPEFGHIYETVISPAMDKGVKFVSWRAAVLNEDGSKRQTEYWHGPTRILDSKELNSVLLRFGNLSLSPIVSVLDRSTVIHACKEAEATLTHNDCLEHPGMLLGTELLVYLRHTQKFPVWLYIDKVMSLYVAHAESGTVKAERAGEIARLAKGYDRARKQGTVSAPLPNPKLILVSSTHEVSERIRLIKQSWGFHFGQFTMINGGLCDFQFERLGDSVGEERLPFLRDLMDKGCAMALPEDIVVYTNEDVGFTTEAPARIIAGVARGHGVTVCPRRSLPNPTPNRYYRTVKNCATDGGMDVIACTPSWWKRFRPEMPDMLIGREAWDLCFRTLAEEWADGGAERATISTDPERWWASAAYTDDVCWHQPHASAWKAARETSGAYNRACAKAFFEKRKNRHGVASVTMPG
jgi:hypothetical protein